MWMVVMKEGKFKQRKNNFWLNATSWGMDSNNVWPNVSGSNEALDSVYNIGNILWSV